MWTLEPQEKKARVVEMSQMDGKKDSATQTVDKPPSEEKEKKTAKTIIQEAVQKGKWKLYIYSVILFWMGMNSVRITNYCEWYYVDANAEN